MARPGKHLAAHALSFVTAMYNAAGGYFYTGTAR